MQLATGLAIQGMEPGRSVIKDSITRVIAILQYNGEPFTDAIGNIDYIWSVSNPSVYHFHHNEL